ncbi:MAG: hypothetical protein J5797_06690 [Prevotella sp.]|nr:hypothetical protein [Prevotella sp.]
MKKKQFFILSMLLCGVLTLFSACNGSKKDKSNDDDDDLEAVQEERDRDDDAYQKLSDKAVLFNSQCPVSLGSLGEMTSLTFEDDLLLFSYDINEDYFNVATLAQDRQAMKDNMKTMLSNPNEAVREIMELVIDADSKLKVTMHGKTTDAVASATFNADELEKILNTEVSPQEKLAISIASTQAQLPLNADAGMMITELKKEGDDVVYVVEMDESMYTVSMVRESKAAVKETIMNNVKNMGPVKREFVSLVVNADANLVYRYATSSGHVDIKITNAELRELM